MVKNLEDFLINIGLMVVNTLVHGLMENNMERVYLCRGGRKSKVNGVTVNVRDG
jgi:hypothetical protein